MSYENAPATQALNTHCRRCKRPLLDATSVQLGIGPECRQKWGISVELLGNDEANKLIAHTMRNTTTSAEVVANIKALEELGFSSVASKLGQSISQITVERDNENKGFLLAVPFRADFGLIMKQSGVKGAYFKKEAQKRWFVPFASAKALFTALKKAYPDHIGYGSQGLFSI